MSIFTILKNNARATSVALASILLVASSLSAVPVAAYAATITNPDLTQSANGQPIGWQTDEWGDLQASFSYLQAGQDDNASVGVTVTNYASGDAKWRFDPVAIDAGQTYYFSDYSKSSLTTHLWAQYFNTDGSVSYAWLGTAIASSDWHKNSVSFTPPSGTVAVSVMHVLNGDGYLDTDTFILQAEASTCTPSESSGIYNGSFAESCDNGVSPARWVTSDYGTNTANFMYLNTGYDDSRSVQTTISSYTNGEAGWTMQPQAAAANQRYQLTGYFKSNIYAYTYVEIQLGDGSYVYVPLMSLPATGNEWSLYEDTFVTPPDTSTVALHVATSAVGTFTIDDFHLTGLFNYTNNKLNEPLISIDFDDGDASAYSVARPLLSQYGFKSTFYINGSTVGTNGHVTAKQLRALQAAGHEIGSHSLHHYDLVTLSQSQLQTEISRNQTRLGNILGQPPTTFATPYGSYNSRVLQAITQMVPYVRATDNAINTKYAFNPAVIHARDITSSTTLSDLTNYINQAKAQGGWLVLVYHDIALSGDQYTISKAALTQQLQLIKGSGVTVLPNRSAIAEVQAQL